MEYFTDVAGNPAVYRSLFAGVFVAAFLLRAVFVVLAQFQLMIDGRTSIEKAGFTFATWVIMTLIALWLSFQLSSHGG
ncbi:MAG: hypothetical protein IBX55_10565 [Methyloprofundus sp.]|nr:hypothetical protein [Methyloprofundus sp.]